MQVTQVILNTCTQTLKRFGSQPQHQPSARENPPNSRNDNRHAPAKQGWHDTVLDPNVLLFLGCRYSPEAYHRVVYSGRNPQACRKAILTVLHLLKFKPRLRVKPEGPFSCGKMPNATVYKHTTFVVPITAADTSC